ncbi:hypothetical protein [Dyella halodurans]|uniref:Uncharacterized protein n=1 Tax=Dyella halodurans TaxID=1920171 RepID=A0ABV9C7R2_9GAMM|nr:hypothetical protein [Dyella halodurans]
MIIMVDVLPLSRGLARHPVLGGAARHLISPWPMPRMEEAANAHA